MDKPFIAEIALDNDYAAAILEKIGEELAFTLNHAPKYGTISLVVTLHRNVVTKVEANTAKLFRISGTYDDEGAKA